MLFPLSTEAEAALIRDQNIRIVCNRLGIPHDPIADSNQLLTPIQAANPEVHQLLMDLLSSHRAYYAFWKKLDPQKTVLVPDEQQELMELFGRLQQSRVALNRKLPPVP